MQEFPKWMYHQTEAARIVDDPVEQDALGPDWAETPAAFDAPDAPSQVPNVPNVPVVVEDNGGEEVAPAADAPKSKRGR
jgi:hypothetical protein